MAKKRKPSAPADEQVVTEQKDVNENAGTSETQEKEVTDKATPTAKDEPKEEAKSEVTGGTATETTVTEGTDESLGELGDTDSGDGESESDVVVIDLAPLNAFFVDGVLSKQDVDGAFVSIESTDEADRTPEENKALEIVGGWAERGLSPTDGLAELPADFDIVAAAVKPLSERKTLTPADLQAQKQNDNPTPEWVEDYPAIKSNFELTHILDIYIKEVGRQNQVDDRSAINMCQVRLFRQLYLLFAIADGAKLKETAKEIIALWKANPGEAFSDARYMLFSDSIVLAQAEIELWRNLGQVFGLAARNGRATVAKHLDIDLIANQIEGVARNQAVGERFREYFSN